MIGESRMKNRVSVEPRTPKNAYQENDAPYFDYDLVEIEGLGSLGFRGPAIDASKPYIAFIGGAQVFGRFCEKPYPSLVGTRLGYQVLNLGAGGAGPRFFSSPAMLRWLNGADLVVAQVMSGRSASNSMFDTRQRGAGQGIRSSDGKTMRFRAFLADLLKNGDRELVARIIEETRRDYMDVFTSILKRIDSPTILLWQSIRRPSYPEHLGSLFGCMSSFPQLVNESMTRQLSLHSDAYVECVSSRGRPQRLWRADQPVPGSIHKDGVLYNRYYPSPEMHEDTAAELEPVCRSLISRRSRPADGR